MTCLRLDLVLVAATCLGVSVTMACSQDSLIKCAQLFMDMEESAVDASSHDFCPKVLQATQCLKAEAVDCPDSARETLDLVSKMLKEHIDRCNGGHRASETDTSLTYVTGSGCNEKSIMSCAAPLLSLDSYVKTEENPDPHYLCGTLSKAKDCVDQKISSCPASVQSIISNAQQALDMFVDACEDPDSIDLKGLKDCKMDKFQECSYNVQRSTSQNSDNEAVCLAVGKATRCYESAKDGCTSKFALSLMDKARAFYDDMATQCEQNGYSTGAGNNMQPTVLSMLGVTMLAAIKYIF